MHSSRKGRAGSKKPVRKTKPSWLIYKPKEIEIGTVLRDSYGIPDLRTVANKSVTQILKENNLLSAVPEDMMALIRSSMQIRKHLETNRKDMAAKRGLQLTDAKIRRLEKYYKKARKLPAEWNYDPERVRLMIE